VPFPHDVHIGLSEFPPSHDPASPLHSPCPPKPAFVREFRVFKGITSLVGFSFVKILPFRGKGGPQLSCFSYLAWPSFPFSQSHLLFPTFFFSPHRGSPPVAFSLTIGLHAPLKKGPPLLLTFHSPLRRRFRFRSPPRSGSNSLHLKPVFFSTAGRLFGSFFLYTSVDPVRDRLKVSAQGGGDHQFPFFLPSSVSPYSKPPMNPLFLAFSITSFLSDVRQAPVLRKDSLIFHFFPSLSI